MTMKLWTVSPTLTRLAAAALVATGLALSIGLNAASADQTLPRPDLLNVQAVAGSRTDAELSFIDKSSTESGFEIFARIPTSNGAINVTTTTLPGAIAGTENVGHRVIKGLKPGQRYCFSVRAYRLAGSYDWSAKSNEICYTMPSPVAIPSDRIDDAVKQLPSSFKPDFVAVRVSGATQVQDGVSSVYEAVIRNDGAVRGHAEMALIFGGSLEAWEMVETPAGFVCDVRTTITCQGSLGGSNDPIQQRVAVLRFRAHADGKGLGSITATVDAAGAISEQNEANNTVSLSVIVK